MKLVVTAMVRDEADIIRQWVDYHVAQGADAIIVTDNGSIDGTAEILQGYADRGLVDLRHDPVQRKQQGTVVTQMARDAYTQHSADWVVNADADEFLRPVDRSLTLRDVFERIDTGLGSFTAPVVNMVGSIAESGAGIDRLVWRDERSNDELKERGVLAQPTHNAIHVGAPDITVVQGNHFVSIASGGQPPAELAVEVVHLPWRSWKQLSNKVEISGRAYEANPTLMPSPNHHGMLDYRRYQEGSLFYYYAARMVTEAEAVTGPFTRDESLGEFLAGLDVDRSAYPADVGASDERTGRASAVGVLLTARDAAARRDRDRAQHAYETSSARIAELDAHARGLEHELEVVRAELAAQRARKVVRIVDQLGDAARRIRR
ncbi:glycosyl transferase family 2 [Frondihabitans sp. PhB188]|uniref:glycosyltransferase family 2 protein n=1 Tax=Frondihabitans sp. PhB188 TaxID=2485200 RepID=UPI000FB3FB21|nr:glycosyltransferase family 2 protein [Frondihabitans sp. PhB188]ROQ36643.1 glycosyl transferase family 2 [Frondihabitans sp. PhB188]